MSATNNIGLSKKEYAGGKSTLCVGCGHDSITNQIITAFFQSGIHPYKVAKLSGIGCSSKTPAYFMNLSHGFNSLHGRMAPVALGAKIANPGLTMIGVSGDGDTASIGLAGFVHLIRRNLPMVYIIENNGVYGLTKGQFSATADRQSTLKSGELNPFSTIDLCSMAIDVGCGFVARSFSGDSKQMVPLLDAAIRHKGTAVIDVVSPCVTFNNHEGSTKSYTYVKEHKVSLQELGFIQPQEEIKVDYDEGSTQEVELHDGSKLLLKKLDSTDHNIGNAEGAIQLLHQARNKGEVLTGLFYLDENLPTLMDTLKVGPKPASQLTEQDTRPQAGTLQKMMTSYR